MLKSGFRGERKRKGTRPQAIGTRRECDGKGKKPPPCPLREGECSDGKGEGIIRELANLKMRK